MNQNRRLKGKLWRRIILVSFFLYCSYYSYDQKVNHVVLISIDGFRPDFYLDETWEAPNLKMMMKQGAYAKGVRSVFPSVTYPAHTTIVTGAYPAKHGIYYNAPHDGKKGQWYWEESYIRVPTLWDAVHEAGLRSGSVMWPVTVGAPIDYNFPVKRADDDKSGNQLEVTLPVVTPANLMDNFQKHYRNLTAGDFNTSNTIDVTIGNLGAYIINTYKPNLMALHFVTVDHQQHEYGREGAEIRKAVKMVDSMIGVVMAAINNAGLANSTNIIITGDHGFINTSYNFSPNVLLQQNQLFRGTDNIHFHSSGGAAFLYAGNKEKKVIDQVKSLLDDLPDEQKKAFRIIERKVLDSIGANPEVMLALAMNKSYVATNNVKGELMAPKKPGGAHGYYPDLTDMNTGFIAFGPGIMKNSVIDSMGIQDLAPLIARMLGLSFKSPDGLLVPGILKK